jgi:outer membrane receptor protein involved in Fe transport
MRYARNAFKFNVFTNILNGDASTLVSVGVDGKPIPFTFKTKTFDLEAGNITTVGTRQVISYGGNVRFNNFDLSIAPLGTDRTELGAYVQDEVFFNNYVRLNLGARFDKFDSIDDPVFSPRVALVLKPLADHAVRVSYNKAFRAPSLIQNFLDTRLITQLNLGAINPALAGVIYNIPFHAVGYKELTEESTQSFEVAYTGAIRNRATVSAAVYFTKNTDEIFFTQTARYRATAPPPAWPLPAVVLEVLPPACVPGQPCIVGGLPSEFSYRNLGTVKNKGFELGADGAINDALNVFANYSYQAQPVPDFALSELNLPPKNRFNVGFSYNKNRFLGNLSVSYVDEAFWQDVLDPRYAGPTEAYTQVNGAFGVKLAQDKVTASVKVINLTNKEIQSHVFGDIIKRQVLGELRIQF